MRRWTEPEIRFGRLRQFSPRIRDDIPGLARLRDILPAFQLEPSSIGSVDQKMVRDHKNVRSALIMLLGKAVGQGELKSKKNYLAPTKRTTAVHPKRMTKKSINCLTSLGSINPPCFPKSWRYFVFFLKIGNRKYSFLTQKPL